MAQLSAAIALFMMLPTFFKTPKAFRQWLETHAGSAEELLVGYHKVGTGEPCMSWSESVDEALCFGWIDGVRKRIDEATYSIRFTPRKPTSIWSAINIAKVEQLRLEGRMTPAGLSAFAKRTASRSAVYSHEQDETAKLLTHEVRAFEGDKTAWAFFELTPPSYKKRLLHWVCSAKKPETRSARLTKLIEACAAGQRLG
ncbi:YdeI/OmpD-associated family protein [Variovorax sp. GB1P17]|uniref:YdeI/OmpD-associated family protein n=1 Tax=Variovorax sp. GB1P17 TaxID=3443740 RepID=UPI003F46E8A9